MGPASRCKKRPVVRSMDRPVRDFEFETTKEPMIPSFRAQKSSARPSRRVLGALAAGAAAATLLLASGRASAQTTATSDAVTPTGKGIVGTALLGGEVVDLTMGIIGINRGWPYLVFGGLGMVGGGIGGYFIEQETKSIPEVDVYMLAGGMALVIPTIVVSLNATMYKPPEGTTTEPANNQPATGPEPAQPGAPGTPAPIQTQRKLRPMEKPHYAFSLVDVYKGSVAMGLPAVEVRPLYTHREMWKYGVEQGSEVRVPLFYAQF